jgi:hypothetical protein
MDPEPDLSLIQKLEQLRIEDPDIVAAILAKHGLTLCQAHDSDEPTD